MCLNIAQQAQAKSLSNELTKCDFSITLSLALFVSFAVDDVERRRKKFFWFFYGWCDWLEEEIGKNVKKFCTKSCLFFVFSAYSTNSLTTVAVGKSSLDSHSHFRQPGTEMGKHKFWIIRLMIDWKLFDKKISFLVWELLKWKLWSYWKKREKREKIAIKETKEREEKRRVKERETKKKRK